MAVKHGPCLLTEKKKKKKKIQAFETKCLRNFLHIYKTNDWVRSKINFLVGPQEPLLATVKRRKLAWFWRVTRHNSLFKTILQGTYLEGCATSRSAEKMLDGQRQRVDIPAHAKTTHKGLRQKRLEDDFC